MSNRLLELEQSIVSTTKSRQTIKNNGNGTNSVVTALSSNYVTTIRHEHFRAEGKISATVKLGSQGDDVKKVQEWLNLWRFKDPKWTETVAVDGDFGDLTEIAVKKFFKHRGSTPHAEVTPHNFMYFFASPLWLAFKKINKSNVRDLIVSYGKQHLASRPYELFNRNEGPWVRCYMRGSDGVSQAWCAGFVMTILDCAFSTTGKKYTDYIRSSHSCDRIGNYAKDNGILLTAQDLQTKYTSVKPGDVFLIKKSPGDWTHTGLITGVKKTDKGVFFSTIEGNTNDDGHREGYEVAKRTRKLNDSFEVVTLNI